MAEFFLSLSGTLANKIIDFYLEHQGVLNTLVVLYGVALAMAHYNLQRIQGFLLEQYDTESQDEALQALAEEQDETIVQRIRGEVRVPVIASPYFFALHRITRHNLIYVIGKKEKLPRRRLEELLTMERSNTQVKE